MNIRFTETVEHRFVHAADAAPVALNDLAKSRAYPIATAEIPDTDLIATVWKVPLGAEMAVPDRCADKLVALGYAEAI